MNFKQLLEDYAIGMAPAEPALSPVDQVAVADNVTASEKSGSLAQSASDLKVSKDCYSNDKCSDCKKRKKDCECLEKIEEELYNIREEEAMLFLERISRTPGELKKKKREALKRKKEQIKKIGMSEYNKRLKRSAKARNKPEAKRKAAKLRKKYGKSVAGKKASKQTKKRQGMFK